MKKKWGSPCAEFFPCDVHGFEDPVKINDAEVKERLEKAGYKFRKRIISIEVCQGWMC